MMDFDDFGALAEKPLTRSQQAAVLLAMGKGSLADC